MRLNTKGRYAVMALADLAKLQEKWGLSVDYYLKANEINSQKMQIPIQVAQIKAEADLQVAKLNSDTKLSIANEELDHQEDSMDVQNKQELDRMMLDASNQDDPMLGNKAK